MDVKKVLGIVLLAAGVVVLAIRGFSYTKETHDAKLGPIELSVKEKEHVTLPTWLGAGLVVVGGALLVVGRKK
jgi:uncharacterized membrane protein